MRIKLSLLLLALLTFLNVSASHIIGGEIYYDYLGNNRYKIYIAVFRDCATVSGAAYDNPLSLAIYNSNNTLVQNVSVPFPGSVRLPIIFNNPCVVTPSGFCNEKAVYTTIVTLPESPGGYTVTYQRCCRRPDVINISDPGDTGLTLTTHITGSSSNAVNNSSPRFNNYPPLVLCNNDDLIFDHSATDPDGDVLVYELITPYDGASSNSPQPNPPPPPPYNPILWAGSFNATNPLGPGASISINPNTGKLYASPQMLGMFVVGIRVKEFRNGILIGQTDRDFIFKIINCVITMQAEITPQVEMTTFVSYCQGTTIHFENESHGATNYLWDFGVQGTTTDISTQFEPTFTFPGPGTYTVTLIANPGWPCTDTSTQIFIVNENLQVKYTANDSVCFEGNSIDFNGSYIGPSGTTFVWNFGPNASIPTSTLEDVNDVSFSTSGFIPVTLTGKFGTCEIVYKDSIYIYEESVANFDLPAGHECGGLTVQFQNHSQFAAVTQWDFGVTNSTTDVSTLPNPSFTYPDEGTYTVRLIVNNNNACADTFFLPVTVYKPLEVSFTHNDSLCITDNSFNFDGTVSGPSNLQIAWNFGPNASIQTSAAEDVFNVVYSTAGVFPVTLTASFNSCSESISSNVTIFRVPTINFDIHDGLKCAPYVARFINQSQSDTPLLYFWEFGDGQTSEEREPSHVYTVPGFYTVKLTIVSLIGCVDTLVMTKTDFINVHPSPTSKFSVDPLITDICNARVNFTDQSSGAEVFWYNFDDVGQTSTEANPVFIYTTPGQKRPMQVVTNEWGCKDTSYRNLFIEPFTVYIPNTFTPDGNEFNGVFDAVIYLPVASWEFKIYNRWGEMLFESSDPKIGWDGTYNGRLVQDDTYTYVLKYIGCDNNVVEHTLTGHVNLLK